VVYARLKLLLLLLLLQQQQLTACCFLVVTGTIPMTCCSLHALHYRCCACSFLMCCFAAQVAGHFTTSAPLLSLCPPAADTPHCAAVAAVTHIYMFHDRPHSCPAAQVAGHFTTCSITVLEQRDGPQFIFGLDMLKRHQCVLDLAQSE
jgi:hypothetical protein